MASDDTDADCPVDTDADESANSGWLPDWPTQTEAGSEYDGPLSTHPEWHALAHGVYKGLSTKLWRTPPEPDNADVRKESHWYRGGYVLGTLVQVVLLVGLGEATFDVTAFV